MPSGRTAAAGRRRPQASAGCAVDEPSGLLVRRSPGSRGRPRRPAPTLRNGRRSRATRSAGSGGVADDQLRADAGLDLHHHARRERGSTASTTAATRGSPGGRRPAPGSSSTSTGMSSRTGADEEGRCGPGPSEPADQRWRAQRREPGRSDHQRRHAEQGAEPARGPPAAGGGDGHRCHRVGASTRARRPVRGRLTARRRGGPGPRGGGRPGGGALRSRGAPSSPARPRAVVAADVVGERRRHLADEDLATDRRRLALRVALVDEQVVRPVRQHRCHVGHRDLTVPPVRLTTGRSTTRWSASTRWVIAVLRTMVTDETSLASGVLMVIVPPRVTEGATSVMTGRWP